MHASASENGRQPPLVTQGAERAGDDAAPGVLWNGLHDGGTTCVTQGQPGDAGSKLFGGIDVPIDSERGRLPHGNQHGLGFSGSDKPVGEVKRVEKTVARVLHIKGVRVGRPERILTYWEEYPPSQIPHPIDRGYLMRISPLIQERLKTLRDASGLTSFFFQSELVYEPQELVQKGMDLKTTSAALEQALSTIDNSVTFDAETLEERLRALGSELDLSGRQFFGLLRVATTGSKVSPPLFQTMEVLGRDRCSHRISKAIEALAAS